MTELKEIVWTTELKPGDIVQYKFRLVGGLWLKATKIALFENKLKSQPRFELLSSNYENDYATFKLRILKATDAQQPGTWEKFTAGYLGTTLTVIAAGLWLELILEKVWLIVEKTAEVVTDVVSIAADNWKLILVGFAVILGLYVYWKLDCPPPCESSG